jgi:hypothetical protein
MNNRVEFKPPSDFVDDSGGGTNVWKWVGIGCGAVLVIVGIALAFGAWKTASCCGDVVDMSKYSIAAGQTAGTFANNVARGNLDEAYAATSDAFKEQHSKEQFREMLQEHSDMLQSSAPRQAGVQAQGVGQKAEEQMKPKRWDVSFEFAGPKSETKLIMRVEVRRKGEGEEATFSVNGVEFAERKRVLSAEPPAESVQAFHRHVQRGDIQSAEQLLTAEFKGQSLDVMLDEFGPGFYGSSPKIESVEYGQNTASVVASTVGENEGSWRFNYKLQRGISATGWVIAQIDVNPVSLGDGKSPGGSEPESKAEGADGDEDVPAEDEATEGADETSETDEEAAGQGQ